MPIEQHVLRMSRFFTIGLPMVMNVLWPCIFIHAMIEVGQHRSTIDAHPVEQIVRKHIRIIPAELGRHKIVYLPML
ncbi:hypothetical protein D1872_199450 [compost metagenome]